jgi:glucose dehydrogenase
MPFDHAYHAIIAEGLVFFGSSADNKVYALDAAAGKERWTFFADSPVRCAPAFWRGRLYIAADDGYLYCLRAKTGKLIWKKRGGPREDMILGNSRIISRWPARGAPTIIDDIVYFSAGIWPSEGIYI